MQFIVSQFALRSNLNLSSALNSFVIFVGVSLVSVAIVTPVNGLQTESEQTKRDVPQTESMKPTDSTVHPANLLTDSQASEVPTAPYVVVLGIAQDGGFPQAGCQKPCCRDRDTQDQEGPSCIAIVDPTSKQRWLFECTPQFPAQLRTLDKAFPVERGPGLSGIFLTHAHIGHYAGLVHLGREVMGASEVPVFAMPRMRQFLKTNGPWSQLVSLKNISLKELNANTAVQLNERIKVTPLLVPHRDEFSETVGFLIEGPNHSALFLPDIDKWERWEKKVESIIEDVDVAFLDATFFDEKELPGRNMNEIPHPFISESIQRFAALPSSQRRKVAFIHLNHSNPALQVGSSASKSIQRAGMSVARTKQRYGL